MPTHPTPPPAAVSTWTRRSAAPSALSARSSTHLVLGPAGHHELANLVPITLIRQSRNGALSTTTSPTELAALPIAGRKARVRLGVNRCCNGSAGSDWFAPHQPHHRHQPGPQPPEPPPNHHRPPGTNPPI